MSNPYPGRRPLALFCLYPVNDRAEQVVAHPCNQHLISTWDDGTPVLEVGFNIRSETRHTLATLGRGDADIFVEGASISKIQCSFEIEPTSAVVMFHDRSRFQTTQVYGDNATPFENGRLRRVLVQESLNTEIRMGGRGKELVWFQLRWYYNQIQTREAIKTREGVTQGYEDNPRQARTTDVSQSLTRSHSAGLQQLKMRFIHGALLGAGNFGTVYRAIDIDTGKLMAVKILQQPQGTSEEAWRRSVYYALKREVETLSQISHVCKPLHPLMCWTDVWPSRI